MYGLSDSTAITMQPLKKEYTIAGKKLSFETGKLGLLANGAITMSDEGGNMLFTTAGIKEVGLNLKADFFPLVVDYQEKYYAAGKIGGNRFMKREARPSDAATLTSRMIDRPIRPMFPKGIINDTQIIATTLSSDNNCEMGSWGITSASLALMVAGAPFEGPVSGVKIVLNQDDSYTFEPNFEQEKNAKLHLVIAGTSDAITMVEAGASEVSNKQMLDALSHAHSIVKDLCAAQLDFKQFYEAQYGVIHLIEPSFNLPDTSLYDTVRDFLTEEKMQSLYNVGKKEFQAVLDTFDVETRDYLLEKKYLSEDDDTSGVGAMVYKRVKEVMRKNILSTGTRLDGRKTDEVRKIKSEVGLLPRTHGSALFQRGMTQVLNICTLGGPEDNMLVDGMFDESTKRYIHHYNFPPYSVGEVRMMRGTGRREIGHGRLAERALEPVLPSEAEFPYMIRTVSEVTTCNGSSSMASVCGSTMSLMNAGVPIKRPVSAVAMGMIYDEESGEYKILSDIQAQEDFLGDMDFKVARTSVGITAMQMDVKIKGLQMKVFEEAFIQGESATMYILGEMLKTQAEVAPELSPYAPLIMSMQIAESQIRTVIGKGGETIQKIQATHDVIISIAEDGLTTITAKTQDSGKAAIAVITELLWVPEVGFISSGKIVKIIDGVGAIVEFRGKQSGMIHISKLSKEKVEKIEDIVKVDEMVDFEIIQVDLAKGRIGLKRMEK
ncbi:polyribonucleotide nucleotidyltransferase [Candidatus Gracilibacteria bacterium]|nr:polyribonucleotide nucleotidyltransferase [Candidatus Gracilibacteria bacterium]